MKEKTNEQRFLEVNAGKKEYNKESCTKCVFVYVCVCMNAKKKTKKERERERENGRKELSKC